MGIQITIKDTDNITINEILNILPHSKAKKQVDTMLEVLKKVYMKHVIDDKSIGWDELTDILTDILCELMGDDEYIKWSSSVNS